MSNLKWEVKTKSKRMCRLYFKYLNENNIRIDYDPSLTPVDLCNIINRKLDRFFNHKDQEEKNEAIYLLINNMKTDCSRDFIDDDKLDWLVGNDSACAIMWLYMREYKHIRISRIRGEVAEKCAYEIMRLPRRAMNTQERFKIFTEFLDDIELGKREKNKILDDIKDVYTNAESINKKITWIKKGDDKSVIWAWEYLNKKIHIPHYVIYKDLDEQYLAIYSLISYWDNSDGDRELFLYKMSNAWRQIKNRAKNVDNKLINTYIGSEYKDLLDELTKHYKSTFRKTLEIAIENEYNRITKPE